MHCNTEVARWSLRERGVEIAAPEPSTFVARVPAPVMRAAESRAFAGSAREWARAWREASTA